MKTTISNRLVKTTVLAAFMLIAFTMSAFAKSSDVSKYLVKQFQKQFGNVEDVTWKTTDQFTSASFMTNGNKMSVFYNSSNSIIGISKEVTLEDLPKAAQKFVDDHYTKFKVVSVIEFTDANGIFSYYIQLRNERKEVILNCDELGTLSNFQN